MFIDSLLWLRSAFRLRAWLLLTGFASWLELQAGVIPGELIVRIDLQTRGQATFAIAGDGSSAAQDESITVNMTGEAHYALEEVGGTLISGELLRFSASESVSGGGRSTAADPSGSVATSWTYINHPDFGKDHPGFSGSISLSGDPAFNACLASPLFPEVEWTSPTGAAPWGMGRDLATQALQNMGDIDFTSALPSQRVDWRSTKSKTATASSTFPGGNGSGTATCTVTMELRLTGTPEWEAVFVLDPLDVPRYQDWLPVGGTNDVNPGSFFLARVIVRATDGSSRVPPPSRFTFALRDVTREPGINMNFPHRTEPANRVAGTFPFDLRIKAAPDFDVDPDGQRAVHQKPGTASGVAIECFDYGAFGKLEVTVVTDTGATLMAHLEGQPSQTRLTIPLDENGNQIADAWEKSVGVFGRNLPVNWEGTIDPKYQDQALAGDGISLYEKYRGFNVLRRSVFTVHHRLDPRAKYLFVHNPDRLLSEVFGSDDGFPLSYQMTAFCRVEYVGESGWTGPGTFPDGKRVVNFNCSNDKHVVDQHAIYLTLNPSANPFEPGEWIKAANSRGSNFVAGSVSPSTFAICYPDQSAPRAFLSRWRPASTFQIDTYASGVDHYLRNTVRHHSQTLLTTLTEAQISAFIDNYVSSHWDDYRHKYTVELSATLTHEIGHATGVDHHSPENSDARNPDLVNCTMRYYTSGEFAADLNDRFELKARKGQPSEFCRKIFNCWGQLQITDNPNAQHGLTPPAPPLGGPPPDGTRPNVRLSSTPPADEVTTIEFSTELPWPSLTAGDPLRLWVRLHGATSRVAANWTDGVKIELVSVDAAGNRLTVLDPAAWAGTLQPAGFDTAVLAVTNVTRIREWLAPAAAARLAAGKYVLQMTWDGRNLAPESLLPADGIVTLPAIEFEVQAPATDALLARHHRHLAWAAWVSGDDAGVREHALEATRLDPNAADPLSTAIHSISATAALRLGDALGAARIVSDLSRRFPDPSNHLGEMAATRFATLAPSVRVVEQPTSNRGARLEIAGLAGSTYVLQRSDDLRDWTAISTHTLAGFSTLVEDPGVPSRTSRFYRVLWER